ncbi:hypothetical protein BDW71DRAFT_176571, partial [Aspergillus fruticulosus]
MAGGSALGSVERISGLFHIWHGCSWEAEPFIMASALGRWRNARTTHTFHTPSLLRYGV